jgi:hypothetical protein
MRSHILQSFVEPAAPYGRPPFFLSFFSPCPIERISRSSGGEDQSYEIYYHLSVLSQVSAESPIEPAAQRSRHRHDRWSVGVVDQLNCL